MDGNDDRPAAAAAWLEVLGALPFLAGAMAIGLAGPATGAAAGAVLLAYGAIVLSFVGGVRWGLALAEDGGSALALARSVIPALVAWGAVLAGGPEGLAVLAAAFAAQLGLDLCSPRRAPAGRRPRTWSRRLRQPLAVLIAACLLGGSYLAEQSARRAAEGAGWLEREIALLEGLAGEDGRAEPPAAGDRLRLAEALKARGELDGGASDFVRAAELYRSALGEPLVSSDDELAGRASLGLGECLEALGRRSEARAAYVEAIDRLSALGPMPIVQVARNGLDRSSR